MSTNRRASEGDAGNQKRAFEGPVAWLLGRQLLASLKSTLLYVAFGSKLDARDWMDAEEYPASKREDAERKWLEQLDVAKKSGTAHDFWRDERKEFWFDYMADTGDSMRATYSIAYLCLSDMVAESSRTPSATPRLSSYSERLKFVARSDAPAIINDEYQNADLNLATVNTDNQLRLPRGQFLLVGGDTTYHLADYEGLHKRFQNPFGWAFDDIREDGRLWKDNEDKSWDELRRPLFGIPGNHDYYDQLDGFRRQFHHPVKPDVEPSEDRPFDAPQLSIQGFVRCQKASYVALRLPFDWLLWGLDTELGRLDDRQRKFFRDIKVGGELSVEEGGKPEKLILATCAPTTVFGTYANEDNEKSAKAFYQLSLPRPFLDPKKKWLKEHGPTDLDEGQCRLDLSGDVHHYARYWGTASGENPREQKDREKLPESDYYASVVSGLGGAFHHPSLTYAGEVSEQALYPSARDSREEVARNIFNPFNIITGGGVWAIGALLAFLLFFAATIGNSSRQAVQNFPPLVWAGLSDWTEITPTVPVEQKPEEMRHHWPLTYLFGDNLKELVKRELKGDKKFFHFWGKNPVNPPAEYYWGFGLALGSLLLLGLTFWPTQYTYRKYRQYEEELKKAIPYRRRRRVLDGRRVPEPARKILDKALDVSETARGNFAEREHTEGWYSSLMVQFNLLTWPLVIPSILFFWGAILIFDAFRGFLTPFGHSLLVMLALTWATLAVILALRYSDWLSRMASKVTVRFRHWWLVWAFSLSSALGVIFGFALFGRYNTASDLVTDVLLMLVTLAIFVGLTVLGAFKIKELTKGKGWRVFGGALGFFHALIQFFIPFLLVRKGNALAWIIWLMLMIAMPFAGWGLMKKNWRGGLLAAWLGFGTVMLLLPHAAFHASKYFNILQPSSPEQTTFTAEPGAVMRLLAFSMSKIGIESGTAAEPSGFMLLMACFVAAGVGLLMACAWLSWYLAVALVFNGHNNEAGGAARIEKFKQFIRFRLTENDLTGFVIAVDEPKEHGSQLRPKLIDVIYLRPKRGAKAKAPGAHA